MKKFFTLLLVTATQYSQAQTCSSLDNSFGINGKATGYSTAGNWINVRNLLVQPDGKIIQISSTSTSGLMAVRYNVNGSLDNGYGANSIASAFNGLNTEVAGGVFQNDGKVVVAGTLSNPGSYSDVALARFNTNGTPDNSFGTEGKVIVSISLYNDAARGVAIQPDGKIVVAGYSSGDCFNDCVSRQFCRPLFTLLRLNPNGTTDSSFGQHGSVAFTAGPLMSGIASSVLIQPDGKIIALGNGQDYNCGTCSGSTTSASGFVMARFLPNGAPDNAFGLNGQVKDTLLQRLSAALLQPDGRIVVAAPMNQVHFQVQRYNNDGSVDNGFLQNKISDAVINDMLLLPDGKLALAGNTSVNNQANFLLLRLKNNGAIDSTFNGAGRLNLRVGGPGNTSEGVTGLALQGTQLLAGGFTQDNPIPNTGFQYNQVVVRIGTAGAGIPVSVSPPGPYYPCEGETVLLRPGTAGTYQWYRDGTAINGATASSYTVTSSGTYAVSVTTAGGCGLSNLVLVEYNALPVLITPLSSLNICNGDSVRLQSNESGTVQWYRNNVVIPGATDSVYTAKTAGAYHVIVKNARGCGQSSPATVNVSVVKPPLQWDGVRLGTAVGYLSYRWYLDGSVIAGATSNVLSPTTTGLYKVTIADFGCDTTSNEFNLTCNLVNVSKPAIIWNGSSFSVATTYATYQWYRNDTAISGATAQVYTPVPGEVGAYRVRVANSIGCSNTSDAALHMRQTFGLGGLFINVYPNPATDKITIDVSQPVTLPLTATLYDLQGRRLLQQVLNGGANTVPVYQLAAATYILEIRYKKEKVVLKALVQR